MKSRPQIQRALLRRAIRKHKRTASSSHQALLLIALQDDAIFETVYQRSMEEARTFGHSTGVMMVAHDVNGAPIVDSLMKLLQWFLVNGPTLIEIVKQIAELFGSVQVVNETCCAETCGGDSENCQRTNQEDCPHSQPNEG